MCSVTEVQGSLQVSSLEETAENRVKTMEKPEVRLVDGNKLVVLGMPIPICSMSCKQLPRCGLERLLNGFKHLKQDGDQRGAAEYERKRKNHRKLENSRIRFPITYTLIYRNGELRLTLLFNSAGVAYCRDDAKGNFRKMTPEEIDREMKIAIQELYGRVVEFIDKVYERALKTGEEPDYYDFACEFVPAK